MLGEDGHCTFSVLRPCCLSGRGIILEGLDLAGLFPGNSFFSGLGPFLAGLAFLFL